MHCLAVAAAAAAAAVAVVKSERDCWMLHSSRRAGGRIEAFEDDQRCVGSPIAEWKLLMKHDCLW